MRNYSEANAGAPLPFTGLPFQWSFRSASHDNMSTPHTDTLVHKYICPHEHGCNEHIHDSHIACVAPSVRVHPVHIASDLSVSA